MDDTLIEWGILTFDRTKESPWPLETRTWVLEWHLVGEDEKQEILAIMCSDDQGRPGTHPCPQPADEQIRYGFSTPDLRMLKYRKYFRLRQDSDIGFGTPTCSSTVRRILSVSLGVEYFEDECGHQISELEMYRHVMKEEYPIVLGLPESVLCLGPASIRQSMSATSEDSDTLARFMDVVEYIARSTWYRTLPSLAVSETEYRGQFPAGAQTQQVIAAIRQLFSSDDLFNSACKRYMRLCGDRRKVAWVKEWKRLFNESLREPPSFPAVPGIAVYDLLNAFMYGAGILHSKDIHDHEHTLRDLIAKHGKPHLVMAVQASLRHIVDFAVRIFPVLLQDYRHWLETGQCPKPTRLAMHDLLSSTIEETRGHQGDT